MIFEHGTAENAYGGKAISKKYDLSGYTKGGCSFRKIICNMELIPDWWRSYRESTFANIELSFRNTTFWDTGDLKALMVSGECNRIISMMNRMERVWYVTVTNLNLVPYITGSIRNCLRTRV